MSYNLTMAYSMSCHASGLVFLIQKYAHATLAALIHVIQTFAANAVHETPSKTPNCLCPR